MSELTFLTDSEVDNVYDICTEIIRTMEAYEQLHGIRIVWAATQKAADHYAHIRHEQLIEQLIEQP